MFYRRNFAGLEGARPVGAVELRRKFHTCFVPKVTRPYGTKVCAKSAKCCWLIIP